MASVVVLCKSEMGQNNGKIIGFYGGGGKFFSRFMEAEKYPSAKAATAAAMTAPDVDRHYVGVIADKHFDAHGRHKSGSVARVYK